MILKTNKNPILTTFVLAASAAFSATVLAGTGDAHDHEDDAHHHVELREGHVDLLVLYEEDEGLHLAVAAGEHDHDEEAHGHEDDHGDEHNHEHESLEGVDIVAGPKAVTVAQGELPWSTSGQGNHFFYTFPQSEIEGLPFLGLNTEELDNAQFESGPTLTLTSVEGPGIFFLYQVDAFGEALVHMNSTDSGDDTVTLLLGTHVHMNWAFSEPGDYALTFEISATLAGGSPVVSEPQEVHFHIVGQPTYVHENHADIGLHYEADHGLAFTIAADEETHHHEEEDDAHDHADDEHDHGDDEHDHGNEMHPADVVLLLGGFAVTEVPDNATYAFLGESGSLFYLAGQQESQGVPFIGWNTEELDPLVIGNPTIELHGLSGPGNLFLYEVDAFGEATLLWNSTDAEEDTLELPVGTHRHLNLAVTVPGTYELELHAEASLVAGGEVHTHAVITLQAGGLEGYYGHFERTHPHWIEAEVGDWLYTPYWPWLWNPHQGWIHATGPGGPDHLYYRAEDDSWLYTSPGTFPWYWPFGTDDWLVWGE